VPSPDVAGDAVVAEDVRLAPGAVVGAAATLARDVALGPGAVVGAAATLARDVALGAGAAVGAGASLAAGAQVGAGSVVHDGARLGEGVRIGAHVVIHPGTVVGDGCEVQDHAVLGKPARLSRRSTASRAAAEPLVLEPGAIVCCAAIVFAGARVAEGALVGDLAYVRERAVVGPGSAIGRGSVVDNDVRVGARVSVQTNVYLTAFSIVEDDVFVGPGAITSNDDTMSRHGPGYALRGAVLRRACRVGAGAVLVPGVEVGEEAFVAAGAVVTRDVPPGTVVMGVPARVVRDVPAADRLENWRAP